MIKKDNILRYNEIFNECYPEFKMSVQLFSDLLIRENTKAFDCINNDNIVGFALVEDFAIRLICILPDYQRNGLGTKLLLEAEHYIKSNNFEKVITGGVSSGFIIGADYRTWSFFEKNGYASKGQCDEMYINLNTFTYSADNFRGHNKASYGWYEGDADKLRQAVADVDEEWVQYFNEGDNVFVGMVGDEIACFCLVDLNCRKYLSDKYGKVGMPGCVGTVHKYRNQGIAIEMVALATQYLKEKNMDISFIFFTGVADWYKKIGYNTYITEIFGEKLI